MPSLTFFIGKQPLLEPDESSYISLVSVIIALLNRNVTAIEEEVQRTGNRGEARINLMHNTALLTAATKALRQRDIAQLLEIWLRLQLPTLLQPSSFK